MADKSMALLFFPLLLLAALWLYWRFYSAASSGQLPPGPPGWPVVGNLFQIALQRRHFVFVVGDLRKRYGDIFTLRMGRRTVIVVTSPELIHEALVKRGAAFASRPADSPTRMLFSAGKCGVNSAPYGPLWRALRRNLVEEVASPQRVKSFAWIRERAVASHLARLRAESAAAGAVHVLASCRFTICSILLCICFGAKMSDERIRRIEGVLKEVIVMSVPQLPDFLPWLAPLFRSQLAKAKALRKKQMELLAPLVRARKQFLDHGVITGAGCDDIEMVSAPGEAYVDSLFSLPPVAGRTLGESEMVTLCSEAVSGGTDTSATTLEWAMLRLVMNPAAQEMLHGEVAAAAPGGYVDAEAMPYLQAVVKETLRRHPPTHFLLSHAAAAPESSTELAGYRIPADAYLEFYTAWAVRDPAQWADPGEWRPERFLDGGDGSDVDVTGARGGGVRMVPFGTGRRICPGASLGMLHVQLLLAAMVREFRWLPVAGEAPPDPAESFAFTVVMKNPLRATIVDRKVDAALQKQNPTE